MMGSCYACAASITPGDGPGLLWPADETPQTRHAFHLACWLAWRRAASEATPTPLRRQEARVAA